jgi:hypothetical protein
MALARLRSRRSHHRRIEVNAPPLRRAMTGSLRERVVLLALFRRQAATHQDRLAYHGVRVAQPGTTVGGKPPLTTNSSTVCDYALWHQLRAPPDRPAR